MNQRVPLSWRMFLERGRQTKGKSRQNASVERWEGKAMHLRESDGFALMVLPGALNRGRMDGERRLLELSEQVRNSLGEYEPGRQSVVWMIAQLRRN